MYKPLNPLDEHCDHIADPDKGSKMRQLQLQQVEPCKHKDKAGIGKSHDKGNNNVIESFNSIQRLCYNPSHGIKKPDSAIFRGFLVWYNYLRKHGSLGCTPAEAAGVMIHGRNKIITLIGNASVAAMGRGGTTA